MDQYQLGVALAAAHLAELHGQADRRRLASRNRRVQHEEAILEEAQGWVRAARRRASVALWSSGAAILLAVVALLTG
jgi:hypothetical protein